VTTVSTPAGWYPDPDDPRSLRWYDGAAWTSATAVAPQAAQQPTLGRSRRGWWIAGGVVLAVLALGATAVVGLVLAQRGGAEPILAPPSATAEPTPSPTPDPEGSGETVPGGADGVTLATFEPDMEFLPGVTTELIEDGDQVDGERTLSGWCSTDYPSEDDRVARRQWQLVTPEGGTGWSVEVVAYSDEAAAAAAFDEFVERTDACTDVRVVVEDSVSTQDLITAARVASGPGVQGYQGTVRIDGRATGSLDQVTLRPAGGTFQVTSIGIAQQAGRYLSIVWANSRSGYTDDDREVLTTLREQQADLLREATAAS
jgi:hypothetical protein